MGRQNYDFVELKKLPENLRYRHWTPMFYSCRYFPSNVTEDFYNICNILEISWTEYSDLEEDV